MAIQRISLFTVPVSGSSLDPEFEIYITKFKDVYMGLGISITLKVHILTDTFQNFVEVIIIL